MNNLFNKVYLTDKYNIAQRADQLGKLWRDFILSYLDRSSAEMDGRILRNALSKWAAVTWMVSSGLIAPVMRSFSASVDASLTSACKSAPE